MADESERSDEEVEAFVTSFEMRAMRQRMAMWALLFVIPIVITLVVRAWQ